jgi:flagellin-like hook-associated protein FlgL
MTGNNDDNQRLKLEATETGSHNFVQVSVVSGSFRTFCPQGNELSYLAGTDAVATINGLAAYADGNNISIDTGDLSMSMKVENRVGYTNFNITGGGAILQTGPNVVSAQQMRLGIGSMLSTQLGGSSGKLYQLKSNGDADLRNGEQARVLADAIVNDAISYVANVRGRLGAIQRSSLEPNVSMLQDSLLALSEANQQIEEADFAEESSNLTRYQLLIQSGMQGLSLANSLPQYAASLVRG